MNDENLKSYLDRGFLCFENLKVLINENIEQKIISSEYSIPFFESDGQTLRSYYGFHRDAEFKNWIQKQEIIKGICQKIYPNESVYIHQSKVNIKNKDKSSVWPYHRDFPFWNVFDGIIENRLLNVVVFLDEVNESNGALSFIPGSQIVFLEREKEFAKQTYTIEGSASSDLLFGFNEEEIRFFQDNFGQVRSTGPKGTILIFDPNTIHGSSHSSTDFSRKLMILTFNACSNKPKIPTVRPEYLCSTDFSPLQWI